MFVGKKKFVDDLIGANSNHGMIRLYLFIIE